MTSEYPKKAPVRESRYCHDNDVGTLMAEILRLEIRKLDIPQLTPQEYTQHNKFIQQKMQGKRKIY